MEDARSLSLQLHFASLHIISNTSVLHKFISFDQCYSYTWNDKTNKIRNVRCVCVCDCEVLYKFVIIFIELLTLKINWNSFCHCVNWNQEYLYSFVLYDMNTSSRCDNINHGLQISNTAMAGLLSVIYYWPGQATPVKECIVMTPHSSLAFAYTREIWHQIPIVELQRWPQQNVQLYRFYFVSN